MRRALVPIAAIVLWPAVAPAQTPSPTPPVTVQIFDNYYVPIEVQVPAGGTVLWQYNANAVGSHTVTSQPGSAESFDEPMSKAGNFAFTHRFDTPGLYPYYCRRHGTASPTPDPNPERTFEQPCGMCGQVKVTGSAATPNPAPTAAPTPVRTATPRATARAASTPTIVATPAPQETAEPQPTAGPTPSPDATAVAAPPFSTPSPASSGRTSGLAVAGILAIVTGTVAAGYAIARRRRGPLA